MSGRSAPRSKTGCFTCRRRKVKCDEQHPSCRRCSSLGLKCDWVVPGKVDRGGGSKPGVKTKPTTLVVPRRLQPAQPALLTTSTTTATKTVDSVTSSSSSSSSSSPCSLQSVTKTRTDPSHHGARLQWTSAAPLYHQVSTSGMPCANSLTLSDVDRGYFRYFPSSTVVSYYMKQWSWSVFNTLYQGPAADSGVVMRLFMALSAGEMHRGGLVTPHRPPGWPAPEDHARYYYGAAVGEFRQLLLEVPGTTSSATGRAETIFLAVFLMIVHEWHFGRNIRNLSMHITGMRSLLQTHPDLLRVDDLNTILLSSDTKRQDVGSSVSRKLMMAQLLLWILYIDVTCRPMGLTESLFEYVLESRNPALHPSRVHRCARLWSRCHWGSQYPEGEVADDMENYRAFELLNESAILGNRVWSVFRNTRNSEGIATPEAEALLGEITAVLDKYSDLFMTIKLTSGAFARRTLISISTAAATVYAHVILQRRLFRWLEPPTSLDKQAVDNMVDICRKQHACSPRLLQRLRWPLLVAAIDTDDAVQRDWLLERMAELKDLDIEGPWTHTMAQRVIQEQANLPPGSCADFGAMLREYAAKAAYG